MIKITHLTSAHPRYDTRIFIKECQSLARIDAYDISLVVADGLGDEVKNGVHIVDVGAKSGGRLSRMTTTVKKVYEKAKKLDSDIYHLHDPELIPMGLKLKKLGKKVIFDAHEDLPKQIMAKHYLNDVVKKVLSVSIAKGEKWALKHFDLVVAATPLIKDKFLLAGIPAIDINNYPVLDELINIEPTFKYPTICYVGLLYESRGIREIVQAIEGTDVKLIVAGKFFDPTFEAEIKALKGWKNVDFRGFVDRKELKKIFKESVAGLVVLHPTPSYMEAYPVKMFEYMSAGIAVIASNFPLYKTLLGDAGMTVEPSDVMKIKEAIVAIVKNKESTKKMGKKGKEMILEKYNWGIEEKKLYKAYKDVLS